MNRFQGPETGNRSPEQIVIENAWATLDEHIEKMADKKGPLFEEYARKSATALPLVQKLPLFKQAPNGKDLMEKAMIEINDLYDSCVEIRAKILEKFLATHASMIMGGMGFRKYFETIVMVSPLAETKIGTKSLKGIEDIIDGLETSIEDIQSGNAKAKKNGFYKVLANGKLGVNFGKIEEAQNHIAMVRSVNTDGNSTEIFPGLSKLLDGLDTQLRYMQQTDPGGPERNALYALGKSIDIAKGPFDWRPLKLAGLVTTGFVTVFGVGLALAKSYNQKQAVAPDIATIGWGAGLLALAAPGLFMNPTAAALQTASYVTKNLEQAEKIGTGIDARKIYEEFQGLASNPQFKKLLKQDEVSIADIGEYTTNPIVLRIFRENFKDDSERAKALKVLGAKISNEGSEFMSYFIEFAKVPPSSTREPS